MEKPPVNPVNKVELPKTEQGLEHFLLSEQEKNIQEVFKLNPELENIAIEATKSSETISLYRIENKNIEKEPDGITSHKDLKGQWFTPDLETALVYLRKSQQTFGIEAKRVEGANLVVVKIPKKEFENLHVSKHPIASQMDVENDNYIVPENIERNYINLDDVQDKVGNFENLQKAKEQIKEKVKQFETKEAVELYHEYLKTIFPESKVQDIVWHGTKSTESFDEFDIERESSFGFKKHGAVFFTSNIEDAKTRGSGDVNKKAEKIIPALVNIKNPLVSGEKDAENEYDDVVAEGKEEIEKVLSIEDLKKKWEEKGWKDRIEGENLILTKLNKYKQIGLFDNKNNLVADLSHNIGFIGDIKESQTKEWKDLGFDGIIDDTHIAKLSGLGGDKTWIAIFNPKDSHILGSQNDIEKFKEFVSKNENKNDKQSIKKFLKEQGLENIPNVETHFFFNQHSTIEDGKMVADRLDDKDIFIQENAGWDKERLETWRKISSGEFTPEQAIEHEKERGKPFFWPDYFKTIFEKLHRSNKEVLLVDVKSDSEVYQELISFFGKESPYWNLVDKSKSYEETCERIANISEFESILQTERENEILVNMKTNLLELLKEKPELQNKKNLKMLFSMGSFHTRLYHEMKKSGDNVSREFQSSPYTFHPRMAVERVVHFKGSEKAKEYMPKILLLWLLERSNMKYENISNKVLSRFSDEQTRELFEMYKKSESDDKFRDEAQTWVVEQFKKKN